MSEQLVSFLALAAKLKTLKRAGWQRCGVEPCESVAEHTFGVTLLALVAPQHSLNRERCVAMALVHDLAEAIVGDLTPHDAVTPGEKSRRELAAMERLAATLGETTILDLWHEFEAAQTPEAMLVRDLDVIEMAWQATEYVRTSKLTPAAAETFFQSARDRVRTPAGRNLLDVVMKSG